MYQIKVFDNTEPRGQAITGLKTDPAPPMTQIETLTDTPALHATPLRQVEEGRD